MWNLLLVLAVVPGIYLLLKVYKLDAIEKEPRGLLIRLFVLGALTVVSALILETIGTTVLDLFAAQESTVYAFFECFFVVALSEEWGKFVVMKKLTWRNKAFDYRFDAIVYSVCSGMGFAVLENIMYAADGDLYTVIMRAVTSIPGHAVFAIFMGYFYGEARLCRGYDDETGVRRNMRLAFIVPVLLHGFYDFCLSTEYWFMVIVFFIFIGILYKYTFKMLKKWAEQDVEVDYKPPVANEWDYFNNGYYDIDSSE